MNLRNTIVIGIILLEKRRTLRMATKFLTIKGTAKWARVFEDNRDLLGFEGAAKEYGGQYVIDVYPDKENLDKLKDAGSRLQPKLDEDGKMFIKFKRKHEGPFPAASGAPKVINKGGDVWSFEDDGPIGNGSEVEVNLVVYDTRMGKGTRLEGVKVLNLVEYNEASGPKTAEEEDLF
jgi:hypothetical protein